MTSHELAKQLLSGPDMPVVLALECAKDTVYSLNEDGKPGPNETVDEIVVKNGLNTVTISVYITGRFGWID